MSNSNLFVTAAVATVLAAATTRANPFETTAEATAVLQEIWAIPARGIPLKLLQKAHGVAVIPGVIKAGFVLGARHGKGLVVARDDNGNWTSPVFITITGGSIGWQAGAQSTDLVLVFTTRRSVDGFLNGHKITLGADAAVAAGPVGRRAEAGTDLNLSAEIYSYSRSRGLFAGVSLGGAKLKVDHTANAIFYQSQGLTVGQILANQVPAVPPVAVQLNLQLSQMTGAQAGGPPVAGPQMPVPLQPQESMLVPPANPAVPEDETPTAETAMVDAAAEVLDEVVSIPAKQIPMTLLEQAQAIVIFPSVVKAGFVVGGRYGKGVLVVRADGNTGWSAPVFVRMVGGSVGWQVGAQATDVVLVFTSRRGVDDVLRGGNFTLGADAAVAAGPVGRQAEAATDFKLDAEIYSYSRSRGLFAGLAIEGGKISVDSESLAAYYRAQQIAPAQVLAGQVPYLPRSAANLAVRLTAATTTPAPPIGPPTP